MKKYRIRILSVLLLVMSVLVAPMMTTKASGVYPVTNGGTDVIAGVAVDYMGKIIFHVSDRKTGDPLEGASVELWVASLDRYVLFGMTNEEGYYEVEVAYAEPGEDYREQYSADGSKFDGILLRFPSNKNIRWRVYKSGWLEYPTDGVIEELNFSLKTDPVTKENTYNHVVRVTLYQEEEETEAKNPKDSKDPKDPPKKDSPTDKKSPGTGGALPKTGVQTQLFYWGIGLLMLLAASGLLIMILYGSRRDEEASTE